MKIRSWVLFVVGMITLSSCTTIKFDSWLISGLPEATTIPPTKLNVTATLISTSLERITATMQPSENTKIPDISLTSNPTLTPTDTLLPNGQTPTATPSPAAEIDPLPTKVILSTQKGSPVGISNFSHSGEPCEWMGVAGQVLGFDDLPIKDLVVELGGILDGKPIFGLSVTGKALSYGQGGYEIQIGETPIASDDTIWIQVFDLYGNPLSVPTYFSTYDSCDKNLILLNFVQDLTLEKPWVFLPLVNNKK